MEFLKRHKKIFMTVVVLICVISMFVSASINFGTGFIKRTTGFILTPVMNAFSGAGRFVGDRIKFLANIGELDAENKRLAEEIENMRLELNRLELVEQQNSEFLALFGIYEAYSEYKTTGALVVAKDPGNWYDTIRINKGTNHGIKKNMAVMAAGGVLGRIIETGSNNAKILSIIQDTSVISSKCARTGNTGFLRGDYDLMLLGLCRMDFTDDDAEFAVGDEIVTSHLSSYYPPELKLGKITEIKETADGKKYAIVEPVVDVKNVQTVLVILQLFEYTFE